MSKAKMTDALMDAIATTSRVSGATGGIIAGLDVAIKADLSNDSDLLKAEASLKKAIQKAEPGGDCEKACRTAMMHLMTAMEKDFADITKEQLKAAVIPYQRGIDEEIQKLKSLMGRLNR